MRKFMLLALLGSLTCGFVGCGDAASTTPAASDEGPKAPGVPTDGPEAPKASKAAKSKKG
ncbi:hypothetical protein [Planctomyces sp. SH-PL62]|uniref:hypothetical protein n=1 Tax=Planctomyces sp. SH-PL62 TaxID=1636152 RepID=UPI00078D87EE|nr:hypothetical protein [Planctomyces sp. SH-PL62]AMV37961.1 hypothetical protein VT85_11030 [Planctomyces sp. SH-PL62]